MANVTYPKVFPDPDGNGWIAHMLDKKTQEVWGIGRGETRTQAIQEASKNQPKRGKIRQAIGWITKHPIIGGALVGGWMGYRKGTGIIRGAVHGMIIGLVAAHTVRLICRLIGYDLENA